SPSRWLLFSWERDNVLLLLLLVLLSAFALSDRGITFSPPSSADANCFPFPSCFFLSLPRSLTRTFATDVDIVGELPPLFPDWPSTVMLPSSSERSLLSAADVRFDREFR
ncbi:unnamed protein product, partial [Ectocarpus sp. 8 AP-2014]